MKKLLLTIIAIMTMTTFISGQDIKLPEPQKNIGKPLMQALSERKSSREFSDKDLSLQELSNLLWAANGFNRADKRTVPTALNKQELELYFCDRNGIYFYDAKNNVAKLIKKGDYRASAGHQEFVGTAAINILFVCDNSKSAKAEFSYTNCGYISQNIYLYCASEGLATVARGSFDNDKLIELLNLDSNFKVLLAQSVGYPK